MKNAYFAGGCFWCMEAPFLTLDGVEDVIPGYMGGLTEQANYEAVCTGSTGHYEVVRVTYDDKRITYNQLLEVFWDKIDPTDEFGQLMNRGPQYKTVVFFETNEEMTLAEASKNALEDSGRYNRKIVTELIEATIFYEAESYHHHYYEKMKQGFSGVSFT